MIALLFASHKKIHMVSPNEELVKRDKVDFKNLFLFLTEDEPEIVEYHFGIAFKSTESALAIVDEAD